MAGGYLNLISEGQNSNLIQGTNGDLPPKTFFKVAYSKHTNFGLQKFRLDYKGQRELRLSEPSVFTFKVGRYADLLMDSYLVINLPNIWSPIYHPTDGTSEPLDNGNKWVPYEFKWIRDLGTNIIKEVSITCGSTLLHRYTGDYLAAVVERDYSSERKELFNQMTGNVPELNDPGNANNRLNSYPSAFYTTNTLGAEPSIRGRALYIPIHTWFTYDSKCAFPLVALQYNELEITVTLRPIQEMFQVRDITDADNKYPYIQPDFNSTYFQMYRFLQTPPSVILRTENYTNLVTTWNADIHIIATYGFLSNNEATMMAAQNHAYLIKDVIQYQFTNVVGSNKLKVNSLGMVSSWMFYMQRNDVNMRNEWSNYTNYPYNSLPSNIRFAPTNTDVQELNLIGPYYNPDGKNTGLFITGDFSADNQKEILQTMGILMNGLYRENVMTRGVFEYLEKFTKSKGFGKYGSGLYTYNFCLDTSPFEYQPTGGINMSNFKTIELEVGTYTPQVDPINSEFRLVCDSAGTVVSFTKQNWRLYEYNYNLTLFEERYNVVSIMGGNCGLLNAR